MKREAIDRNALRILLRRERIVKIHLRQAWLYNFQDPGKTENVESLVENDQEYADPDSRGGSQAWGPCTGCVPMKLASFEGW